jgi:hypothetical protein
MLIYLAPKLIINGCSRQAIGRIYLFINSDTVSHPPSLIRCLKLRKRSSYSDMISRRAARPCLRLEALQGDPNPSGHHPSGACRTLPPDSDDVASYRDLKHALF